METTAQRIRRLRREAFGETYREADKATGISTSNWANWETKGTEPYGKSLTQLAAALSAALRRPVTTDEILTGQRVDADRIVSELDRGTAQRQRRGRGTRRPSEER